MEPPFSLDVYYDKIISTALFSSID